MVFVPIPVRLVIVAIKYGFAAPLYVKRFQTETIPMSELNNELVLLKWREQRDDVLEEEFQTSVLRNEIDIASFYMRFLHREDHQGAEVAKKSYAKIPTLSPKPVDSFVPLANMSHVKKFSVRKYVQNLFWAYANMPSPFEEDRVFAYKLGEGLLRFAKCYRFKGMLVLALIVSGVRAIIPTMLRLGEQIPPLGTTQNQTALIFCILFFNNIFYMLNILTVWTAICDLKMKRVLMSQLAYLLTDKIIDRSYTKCYPTINVFDPVSLRAWASLRKSLFDYGSKFVIRNNANITAFFVVSLPILIFILMELVGITNILADHRLTLVIFSYESGVAIFTFFIFLLFGAQLNDFFLKHRTLLKRNKDIVSDFIHFTTHYADTTRVASPNTKIYMDALRTIQKEYGIDDKDFNAKVKQRFEELQDLYNNIIEDLVFAEANDCFKVLGFKCSWNFLKQISTALVSAAVFIFKNKYGN